MALYVDASTTVTGIYIYMLPLSLHDSFGSPSGHHPVVPQLPDPRLRIPPPPRILDLSPHHDLGHCHPNLHEALGGPLVRGRCPGVLLHNQFHRLEAFLLLLIVPVAHTYQTVPVLCKQLFRPALVRVQG